MQNHLRKLIIVCFLVAALPARAEVTESLQYTYYQANATRSRSLAVILNDASPHRESGKAFLGITDWTINWQLEGDENPDGKCRITKVITKLSVTINLPKLNGATSKQVDQFDRLLAALRVHELGHYAIAQQAAAAIDDKMRSLPGMASCKTLTSTASELESGILDEYEKKEVQYDVMTDHGKTQGAWLGE